MRKGKREKAKRAKGEEVNRQEEKGGKRVPGPFSNPFSCFDGTLVCDGQTDRHWDIASIALCTYTEYASCNKNINDFFMEKLSPRLNDKQSTVRGRLGTCPSQCLLLDVTSLYPQS